MWSTGWIIFTFFIVAGIIVVIAGMATDWFGTSKSDDNASAAVPIFTSFNPSKGNKCTCDMIFHHVASTDYIPITSTTTIPIAATDITIDLRCQSKGTDSGDTYAKCGCQGLLVTPCTAGTDTSSTNETRSVKLSVGNTGYSEAIKVFTSINPTPKLWSSDDVSGNNLYEVKTSGSGDGSNKHRQIVYQKVGKQIPDGIGGTTTGTYVSLDGTTV